MESRENLSALLWALHLAAQDASNEPTKDNINLVRDINKRVQKAVSVYLFEKYTKIGPVVVR